MVKTDAGYKFKPGNVIHESLVHRKYRDVDNGEVFVSLFGVENRIFRVDSSNRFIYDTPFDSSKMPELILMEERRRSFGKGDDASMEEQESGALDVNLRPYLKTAYILKNSDGIAVYDEDYQLLGTLEVDAEELHEEPVAEEPVDEYEAEAEPEPEAVEEDKEEKTSQYLDPDLKFDVNFGGHLYAMKHEDGFYTLLKKSGRVVFEYYSDDKFIGVDKSASYLVFSGSDGVSYGKKLDGSMVYDIEAQDTSASRDEVKKDETQHLQEPAAEPVEIKLSQNQIVDGLVKAVTKSVNKNGIEAEYYITERLSEKTRLLNVMGGNLGVLNDETSEAASNGAPVNHKAGYSLLKAALLHELFINTTLGGRGGHRSRIMRQFILELILITERGRFEQDKSVITGDNQKRVLNWLMEFRKTFTDKREVIESLINRLMDDDELKKISHQKDYMNTSMFKALVISKVYEYTTRLDRGNGLAIIALSRAVMDISQKSA